MLCYKLGRPLASLLRQISVSLHLIAFSHVSLFFFAGFVVRSSMRWIFFVQFSSFSWFFFSIFNHVVFHVFRVAVAAFDGKSWIGDFSFIKQAVLHSCFLTVWLLFPLILSNSGYMAPEYAIHGRFSVKSDVFSFGVLVLEVVSGKRVASFRSGEYEEDLLTYAWRNWREDTVSNVIDPALTTGLVTETMKCIYIGLLCVQETVDNRPTMASVVSMFNSHSVTLSIPSRPADYMHSTTGLDIMGKTESTDESKNSGCMSKNEESNITELYTR